jgi:hypothetical protein
MYMVVFVTLMVALIGAYAQIYTKQAASGFAQQSGIVNSLVTWHATAMSLAQFYVQPTATNYSATTGCSLTNGVPPTCTGSGGGPAYISQNNYTAVNLCSGAQGPACFTVLPPGYSSAYTFYSIAFQSVADNADYVLTFIPPPPATSDNYNVGLLCLPGVVNGATKCLGSNVQLSATFNSILAQMKKTSSLSPMIWGTIANGAANCGPSGFASCLVTPTASVPYAFPTSAPLLFFAVPTNVAPAGSIGLIGQVAPCSTC